MKVRRLWLSRQVCMYIYVCFTLLFTLSQVGAANPPLSFIGNLSISDSNCTRDKLSLGTVHRQLKEDIGDKVGMEKLTEIFDLAWVEGVEGEGSDSSGNPTGIFIYRPFIIAVYLKIVDKIYSSGCNLAQGCTSSEGYTDPLNRYNML